MRGDRDDDELVGCVDVQDAVFGAGQHPFPDSTREAYADLRMLPDVIDGRIHFVKEPSREGAGDAVEVSEMFLKLLLRFLE